MSPAQADWLRGGTTRVMVPLWPAATLSLSYFLTGARSLGRSCGWRVSWPSKHAHTRHVCSPPLEHCATPFRQQMQQTPALNTTGSWSGCALFLGCAMPPAGLGFSWWAADKHSCCLFVCLSRCSCCSLAKVLREHDTHTSATHTTNTTGSWGGFAIFLNSKWSPASLACSWGAGDKQLVLFCLSLC